MSFQSIKMPAQTSLYGACLFFAAMALTVKLLTQVGHEMPTMQVAFFRSFLCLILVLPFALNDLKKKPLSAEMAGPMLLRSLAGGLAMIAYFQAIAGLPLATAVLLNYTSPLWAGLFAWLYLNESLSRGVLLAYPLAFTGVLMVVGGPDGAQDLLAIGLGLISAVLAGAAYTALRGLRGTPPSLVVLGLCLVTSVITAPFCYLEFQAPTAAQWGMLWFCAAASAAAQTLLTLGYRSSKTASASTVGLATVAVSGLLSTLVLGETMSLFQWLGIALLLWSTSQTGRRSLLSRIMRTGLIAWRRPALRAGV